MSYRGDIRLGKALDFKFTTRRFSTGAPFALSGGAVAAYVDNGTVEITAGVTLTPDFDGRTGLNNVRVVATSGNGFATATNVDLVVTAGTVDGVSVVGEIIGSFSIEARSALMPTTADRVLNVLNGRGDANVEFFGGAAGAFAAGRPEVNASHAAGTAWNSGAISAATLAADTITAAKIAADAIGASELAADAVTEIQAGLALSTQVDALEGDTATLLARLTAPRATNLDNLDAAISSRAVAGDTMALTAAAVDAVHDEIVDGALTHRQSMRLANAANAGKTAGFVPGSAGSGTVRDPADAKNRISATVDANGNRTAVTTDVS